MNINLNTLQTPISAIIFDCDGTLTTIEGIDELAKHNQVTDAVKALTDKAMSETGINPSLYEERLQLVNPHQKHLVALCDAYCVNQVPDAKEVIQLFLRLKKEIYLVSAGLLPAVRTFGETIGIARKNIYAVDIHFDAAGNFSHYDTQSPLIRNHGKREIVAQIKDLHSQVLYVGDGLNDLVVKDLVTRFVGYGGVFYRDNIAKASEYYLRHLSMTALLPLALTQYEYNNLSTKELALYNQGLALLTT